MKKSRKIWLSSPQIDEESELAVTEALKANWITVGGPFVTAFEQSLSSTLETSREIVVLNSGSAALHLALILAGVQRDDYVLCQTMTYVATANPIAYLGAIPVFVDSEKQSFNLSAAYLEEAILWCIEKGKKPAALIAVHSYGMPFEVEKIASLAGKYEIPLIEDAAEALGSSCKAKNCGLLGDYGVFSFNGNKIITTGGGGALVCKKPADAKQARHLATQAKSGASGFEHDAIGYNYAMPGLNAVLGMSQLKTLQKRIKSKQKNHVFYKNIFDKIPGVDLLEVPNSSYVSNYWLNCIQFTEEILKIKTPEGLRLFLEQHEIESRFLWKPLHLQNIYKSQEYFGDQVAENLWKSGLALPSGSSLSESELNRIKKALIDYFSA